MLKRYIHLLFGAKVTTVSTKNSSLSGELEVFLIEMTCILPMRAPKTVDVA